MLVELSTQICPLDAIINWGIFVSLSTPITEESLVSISVKVVFPETCKLEVEIFWIK